MSNMDKSKQFIRYFGVRDLFNDVIISKVTGKYSLNIIKFDDWLHTHKGYNEDKHGSMSDFITSKFGDDACQFIEELI